MKSKSKPIGITLGDINGIGPEVTAKALSTSAIKKLGRFIIFGNQLVLKRHLPKSLLNIEYIESPHFNQTKWRLGKPNRVSGQCSLDYLNSAVEFLKKKKISALVTAPVCKEAIAKFQPHFQGHTEYLADHFNKKNVGMLFVAQNLKTLIVTRHIPLKRVSQSITSSLLVKSIQMTDQALKDYFKIKRPRLAICGLNPHAGENGLLGREEQRIIIPVIKKLHSNRLHIEGPFPADTLFCPDKAKHYDAIIAMYHDQGLIPIKTLYFHKVVNLTIGLPVIRTSPSHGTAFDIAGKNCANPASMIEAIKLAAQLAP